MDDLIQKPKTCWLTINRACNLRCEWCYGFETSFKKEDDMSISLAQSIIDICHGIGISNFLLIGGEPTIHPSFLKIIEYLKARHCKITVVTNGIRLADDNFCKSIIPYAESMHLGISLKGSSDEYYKKHCGSGAFHTVRKGISNCDKYGFDYSLSYVISADNVGSICQFAMDVRNSGIDSPISFSFCNETIHNDGCFEEVCSQSHPLAVNTAFEAQYQELDRILEGKLSIHQTHPLCMCDKKVVESMLKKNQIATSCHVHNRAGVIFDTNGSILLCNHFIGYGIGEFNKDYCDSNSFLAFWNSIPVVRLHRKLTSMPSMDCKDCEKRYNCGGGCCIQWFNHTFEDYKNVNNNLNLSKCELCKS